ncbi:MAG TPA: amino acid permease [Burkholderiales bacterium]|nr:amino acid permease [Burkholderiales bacterium]
MLKNKLKHGLTSRHILMIALGSAIGTGFFFGSGGSIKLAGPAILLSYSIGGIMMYIIVRALGEMAVAEPSSGSFSYYAYKYIGNYAGFVSGWNYWFNYIIVCMLELTATGIFMDYWFPQSVHWIITLVVIVLFTGINLLNVRMFGEFEFWFAGIKVVTVICLVLFGVYILGFGNNHQQSVSNVSNLWQNGGFFANGLQGFLFSFVVVVFSFGGTELVGITAAEAENPRKTIPMAINGIIVRILLFYIATLAIIMCLYPWNKIDSHISPFVDVFQQIGIAKAASLMNLVAITAALSSLNSGIYGTARMVYNLGLQGNAPQAMTKVSAKGSPMNAIIFSIICIGLTVFLNYLYPKQIFNILLSIATIAAIINWITILVTHINFKRKFTGISHYPIFFYPLSSVIAIIFLVMVAGIMYFMPDFRLAIIIAPIWLCLLSIGYLIKTKIMGK